jgi:hypothetical protein
MRKIKSAKTDVSGSHILICHQQKFLIMVLLLSNCGLIEFRKQDEDSCAIESEFSHCVRGHLLGR